MSENKIDINQKLQINLPSIKDIIIVVTIGLTIGYLGPFGSYENPLVSRLLYWVFAVAVGNIVYGIVYRNSEKVAKKYNVPYWVVFLAGASFSAVLLTFILVASTNLFMNFPYGFWDGYVFMLPQVFIIGIVIGGLIFFLTGENRLAVKTSSEKVGHSFIQRLPVKLGTELICFVMEDHYLRVYTKNGDHLLLHRMKDALQELENYDGMQVHRSWWIAFSEISDVKKDGRKTFLIMSNGSEVPVSKTYLPLLKEKGIF